MKTVKETARDTTTRMKAIIANEVLPQRWKAIDM